MLASSQPVPYQSASLYVGDLIPDCNEGMLFEIFNRVGPVASIRVCRDAVTRRSLGYAYVNFHHVQDAERALDTMNFSDIKGNPCRIMWSQRDPSLRKSGVGNIFVKNLAPTIDNKGLFDTFSVFGNILSCKVVNDENGNSKGYGYVHYETGEAAQEAIAKLNGMSVEDHVVTVGLFLRRQDRAGQSDWTNIYFKQFPLSWDESKLTEIFSAYGPVSSIFISRDENNKSRGFGFVDFKDHEAAAKALTELNGTTYPDENGNPLEIYLNRAQKKAERVREMRSRADAIKLERINKYQGMNLYVKNIEESVDENAFRELFAPFGTITSARIMRNEDSTSRGFGFICFSSPEEATRAVAEMNGKMVRSKPIVVTLHQRKEHRLQHLQAAFQARGMPRGFPMNQAPIPYMGMGMYLPGQGVPPRQQQFQMMGGMMPRGSPRGLPNFGGRGGGFPLPQYQVNPGALQQFKRPPVQGGMPGNVQQGQQRRNINNGGRGQQGGIPLQQGRPNYAIQQQQQGGPRVNAQNIKYTAQARNQPVSGIQLIPGQPTNVGPALVQTHQGDALNTMILAEADPNAAKNMLGEQLYPLIQAHQPELAGKITGMLLEMDNAELVNLIVTPEALENKIEEAMTVLRQHSQN